MVITAPRHRERRSPPSARLRRLSYGSDEIEATAG